MSFFSVKMLIGGKMSNISKSLYCNYVQCKKMIWLNKYKPEEYVETKSDTVMENGNEVGDLARRYFGNYSLVKFNEVLIKMIMETKEYLKQNKKVICEASFKFDNLFASIDILKIDDDGVSIYEVKSSTEVKDIYKDDASFQAYILKKLGYTVKSVNVMYINSSYVLEGELDLKGLFRIEDVTAIAKSKEKEIELNVKEMNEILDNEKEPNIDLDMHCFKPYPCPFFKYCSKHLPEKNVFDIPGLLKSKKVSLYKEGKFKYEDLIKEDLNPKYLEQLDFELNNKEPKINKEEIKKFMSNLKYPLYFIDYETYQVSVPEIQGTRPYQQLPFQYSLHILKDKDSRLEHKEFLADIDDKNFIRHFAESMIRDIPDNGSVIIYNKSFEPARNKEIAHMYPDLKKELNRINDNIIDFMEPFNKRYYYTKDMHGSSSIKAVLPALYPNDPELNYHNLPLVHNGEEASETFLSLRGKTKEEQKSIRDGLLVYCKLDTYAMVKIYERFKDFE